MTDLLNTDLGVWDSLTLALYILVIVLAVSEILRLFFKAAGRGWHAGRLRAIDDRQQNLRISFNDEQEELERKSLQNPPRRKVER